MPDVDWVFSRLDLAALLDMAVVALILYWVLVSIQGTRAVQLLWGFAFLLIAFALSNLLQMTALTWIFKNSIPALLIGIPVIFQPELRRALERLGRTGVLLNRPLGTWNAPNTSRSVDEICQACGTLSARRFGALMVMEQDTGLQEYADTGVALDALVSERMLLTIFQPNTPLHDGAAIVRGDRLVAAGCVLPLSEDLPGNFSIGTRHRAALGISEQSDALAIVVSEETGTISVARNGHFERGLDPVRLKEMMLTLRQNHSADGRRSAPAAERASDQTAASR
jgi:diadenylate cyclase